MSEKPTSASAGALEAILPSLEEPNVTAHSDQAPEGRWMIEHDVGRNHGTLRMPKPKDVVRKPALGFKVFDELEEFVANTPDAVFTSRGDRVPAESISIFSRRVHQEIIEVRKPQLLLDRFKRGD